MSENYEFLQYFINPKENPLYERFLKKQLEFNSRTKLLTDTTIEQINSLRPDGTMVFTGYQSRGPYLNDGSTPEYLNVPLSTSLEFTNKVKNAPTRRNTESMAQKLERERRIINEVEPKPTRSQLRFITEEENLDNEVTNEIIKRQQAQQEFNNQKNKKAIQNEKLIKLSQNERLNLRLQPLIEREKRIANLGSFSSETISITRKEATGLRGRPARRIISYEDPTGKRTEIPLKPPTYTQVTRKRKQPGL